MCGIKLPTVVDMKLKQIKYQRFLNQFPFILVYFDRIVINSNSGTYLPNITEEVIDLCVFLLMKQHLCVFN